MKDIRCFITNANYATADNSTICPVYEISEHSLTFSKRKEFKTVDGDDKNLLTSFHYDGSNTLTQENTRDIINIVETFTESIGAITVENKPNIIDNFLRDWNNTNPITISEFNYNSLIFYEGRYFPDSVIFTYDDMSCVVWLADQSFKLFYPFYDLVLTPPFKEFPNVVRNPQEMVNRLNNFDLIQFNNEVNADSDGYPSTYTSFVNVPYRPNYGAPLIPCYFGFNIYGEQGNYDHILRENIYDYLKDLGLSDDFINEHFPDLFKINEYFVIPEWETYALPFKVGQGSLNSQMTSTYNEPFDVIDYVKVYENDVEFVKNNTTNVPFSYSNLLLKVINGRFTREETSNFREYYKDLITVPTTSPDFKRMSPKTQNFVIMLTLMMTCADTSNETSLFANVLKVKDYDFRVNRRGDTIYLTCFYDNHRYYVIPRYEYKRIKDAKGE